LLAVPFTPTGGVFGVASFETGASIRSTGDVIQHGGLGVGQRGRGHGHIEPPDSLFGLYQGTPLPERSWGYGNTLPDRISIYQGPIEDACEDDEEIRDCVAETVIHEFGHYFGMDEDQIEEIEEKYWRGESLDEI